jgi:hypothetical protein
MTRLNNILRRWRIVLPGEHGSWSLTLTPFLIGAGVAGRLNAPLWLCLLAAFSLFLARGPVSLWLRVRRGRGRRDDGPAAAFWSAVLLGVAGLSGLGLILLGRWQVLWLAIPALGVLGITLLIAARRGPRQLASELVGAVGLALGAPAALIAASGAISPLAGVLWLLCALHNLIGVLYVRYRIDLNHGRATRRAGLAMVAAHGAGLVLVLIAWRAGWLPGVTVVALAALLLRAIYVAWRGPEVADVRRFGFSEMGFALAFAAVVIAGFAIGW